MNKARFLNVWRKKYPSSTIFQHRIINPSGMKDAIAV